MRIILTTVAVFIFNVVALAQQHDTTITKKVVVNSVSHGFTNATTAAIFYAVDDGDVGIDLENSIGYRFNGYFSLCGSSGADVLPGIIMVPVSLNPRFDLSRGKFPTFVNGNLGYVITVNNDYRGMFFGFDYGHKYYVIKNAALLFSMEFRYFINSNLYSAALILKTGIQF